MNKNKFYLIAKISILSVISLFVFNMLLTIVANLDRVLGLDLEFKSNLYFPFILILFISSIVCYLIIMKYTIKFFAINSNKVSAFIICFPILIFVMQVMQTIWLLYMSMTLELPNYQLPN